MTSNQLEEVIIRAAKTFLQAFLAAWAISGYNFDKGAITGAAASAISVIMNLTLTPPVDPAPIKYVPTFASPVDTLSTPLTQKSGTARGPELK